MDCASTGCGSMSALQGQTPRRRPRSWPARLDTVIPRVFTIPASLPFLPTLIAALAAGTLVPEFPGPDPLALSAATVYLPTRRACRVAGELFLEALGRDVAVLPRFLALGDIDEDEFAFTGASGAASLELRPAMPALERRLLLARLIAQWARSPEVHGARGTPLVAGNPAAALTLADDLARLIDDMTTRQVPWHGLDTDLDRKSWECIGGRAEPGHDAAAPAAGHPQFAMHMLLRRIGIDRERVVGLGEPARARARLVSEAFRPAPTTELWTHRLDDRLIGEALAGVAVIEAANAEEEANAIAVALREAIEASGTRAALVTADRALARRVAAALGRWNVAYEDSRGNSLRETQAGVFARLAAEAALSGLPPVTLLALLKHPLFRLGAAAEENVRAIASLERALLRGPAPRPGSAGLVHALAAFRRERGNLHPRDPRAVLTDPELDAAGGLIEGLAAALAPLETLTAGPQRFGEIAAR